VHLHELQLAAPLLDDLVEHRGDGVARAAPLGPEVDENALVALDDLALEVGFRHCGRHAVCPFGLHWGRLAAANAPINGRRAFSVPGMREDENLEAIDAFVVHAASGCAGSPRARARDPRALGA